LDIRNGRLFPYNTSTEIYKSRPIWSV